VNGLESRETQLRLRENEVIHSADKNPFLQVRQNLVHALVYASPVFTVWFINLIVCQDPSFMSIN